MLKVSGADFTVACFLGLSDVHMCLGHIQMAAYPLDKQTAGCNSSHNWLISMAMDLAALLALSPRPFSPGWHFLIRDYNQ